jgi:hypothetical protein
MFLNHSGETEQNRTVVGVEVRTAPLATEPWVRSYGVVDGGFEVMRAAWPKLEHLFSVRRSDEKTSDEEKSPEPKYVFKEPHRLPNNLLNDFPVDLLTIEQEADTRPTPDYERSTWEKLIYRTRESNQPKVIIESWPPNAQLWTKGPACKSTVTRWHDMEYVSRFKRISATDVGGAITQSRLLVARVKCEWSHLWMWSTEETELDTPRPMSNLLTPPGLVRNHRYVQGRSGDPIARSDPMPAHLGAYVDTERGMRRLMPEESGRGLGIPKEWKVEPKRITKGRLERTTSLFHWEYLSSTLSRAARVPTKHDGIIPQPLTWNEVREKSRPETSEQDKFFWKPPDLREGHAWHQQRMTNLRKAAESFPDPTSVVEEGILALNTHRKNYTEDGPEAKKLQLLWWEFPREHWQPLREGSRMNFLREPKAFIHDNGNMNEEPTLEAGEFTDELLDLGVIQTPKEGRIILTMAPLFVVPKEGQEGQWRVIANMLEGGQNECISGDPVFLPLGSDVHGWIFGGGRCIQIFLLIPNSPGRSPLPWWFETSNY